MSSRPILTPHQILNGQAMSVSFTSEATIISNLSMVSYDLSWASGSTPVGVASVQVSNTYSINSDGSVRNAGTWRDFPGATAAVSGNSGTGYFNVSHMGCYAVRLAYTATSGTALMSATINGKVE